MRVLLVEPAQNFPGPVQYPSQALLLLGTLARNNGHDVKIVHLGLEWLPFAPFPLEALMADFVPDVVGVTLNTFQVASARHVVETVRAADARALVVVGGPHAKWWDGDADHVVVGQGEDEWLSILGHGPMAGMPPMDYGLVNLKDFCGCQPSKTPPQTCIMASRGCYASCTFCNTPIFWGTKLRLGNPEYVINEIKRLNVDYGMNEVVFQDDTFNASGKWAAGILERLINEGLSARMSFRLVWRANEKIVTKGLLDLAKRANVHDIYYGVESGSQAMLDRMRKGITTDEVKRAFRMTHAAGITTHASFIVGLPGETKATIEETRKLIAEIRPTAHSWCYFIPFPGTEATREVLEKGHVRHLDYSKYGVGQLLARTDEMTFDDLASFGGL